jgi:Flp pilus assembly protein TadG
VIRFGKTIRRDEQGAAAIELAISFPVLITMIYGIFTFGQVLEATAGMQHALGEGARYGNLCLGITNTHCNLPTATAIKAKVNAKLFGTQSGTFDTPTVDTTTASSGYVTVTTAYHQTMNFLLFTGPTVNITRSKRVYLAESADSSATCSGASTPGATCSIYS